MRDVRGVSTSAASGVVGVNSARGASAALVGVDEVADRERVRSAGGRSVANLTFEPHDVVRVGVIGAGPRLRGLLQNLLNVEHTTVVALADVSVEAAGLTADLVESVGHPRPAVFIDPDSAVDNLLARTDIDLVLVATPWNLHAPMAVRAMRAGKHVAVEVPAAVTLEQCWELVDASEQAQRHCVMLENCCYGYNELLVLNIVRAGLLGSLLHGEAAYIHDLRGLLMERKPWRRRAHIQRDGNLYPTHGLGPIAAYMGINRGDRFTSLVSMSSPHLGLEAWREKYVPAGDPRFDEVYRCGDVNTSLISTAAGRTIVLQHQVVGPRP